MHDITKIKFNKVQLDENGVPYGVLAIDKPKGKTSHDCVDFVRKVFKTRRVGHAGTLDPFAEGLLIVLIGKSTKLSSIFLDHDKEYVFEILFGISTDTFDPEGTITRVKQINIVKSHLKDVLKDFEGRYIQDSPIFSSVKVGGLKLREIARASTEYKLESTAKGTLATFLLQKNTDLYKKLHRKGKILNKNTFKTYLPRRDCIIYKIEHLKSFHKTGKDLKFASEAINPDKSFQLARIKTSVSIGTYIRQLAVDIGKKLNNTPAMLTSLKRTRIGEIALEKAISLEDLST